MLALLLLATSSLPFVSSEVEKPALGTSFSTSLETNGVGEARTVAPTALDAERAFAADAQTLGQWTAFRKWAAPDATMFVPQPTNAQSWLKDRKDPAKSVEWWPTASYVSCDGSLAVNTGGWRRPDGAVGYFSTVWQRQQDGGWKWIVDGGDDLKVARARGVMSRKASCGGKALRVEAARSVGDDGQSNIGQSGDRTLWWKWEVRQKASRIFTAYQWNGKTFRPVIDDEIAPPK